MIEPGRQTLLAIMALAPFLALAGCTGGDTSQASTISAATPSQLTTTAQATYDPGTEEIRLPPGIEVLVDWQPTGDPAIDAAVAATVNSQRAQWAVMTAGDLGAVPYKNYVTGRGERTMFDDFIAHYVEAGVGVKGTDRLFAFQVTDVAAGSATVTFCGDQTDLHVTERATGEIINPSPAPPADWRVTRLVTLTEGRWKVSAEVAEGGVAECDLDR